MPTPEQLDSARKANDYIKEMAGDLFMPENYSQWIAEFSEALLLDMAGVPLHPSIAKVGAICSLYFLTKEILRNAEISRN